jgi:hypothetical protein
VPVETLAAVYSRWLGKEGGEVLTEVKEQMAVSTAGDTAIRMAMEKDHGHMEAVVARAMEEQKVGPVEAEFE